MKNVPVMGLRSPTEALDLLSVLIFKKREERRTVSTPIMTMTASRSDLVIDDE
jgi:hypothetical protein